MIKFIISLESFTDVYPNDDRNNNISVSCLKSPGQVHAPRKNRVTFDPSSRNNDGSQNKSRNISQRTLGIEPRERFIDSDRKSSSSSKKPTFTEGAINLPMSSIASRDPDAYRRSLRLAVSGGGQVPTRSKKEKHFRKTNGFHEEIMNERSVDESPPQSSHHIVHEVLCRRPLLVVDDVPSQSFDRSVNALPSQAGRSALECHDLSPRLHQTIEEVPFRSPQGVINEIDARSEYIAVDEVSSQILHHPVNKVLSSNPRQSLDRERHYRNKRRAAGSFTSTYQVQDDDKRCSSDQSFWSSDYSTSVGGNSEKSNDSSDPGNMNERVPNSLRSKPENFEDFLTHGSKNVPKANSKSLQERLRQRLRIFQNELIVSGREKVPANINNLPEYILLNILSYLSTKYLCIASGVCKKWHLLCWDPQLWRNMKISKYSGSNIDKIMYTILSRLARSTQGLCLTLQYIRLAQCECLSDRGLSYIAKYCIDLEKLEILACPCATNRGVQSVLESCLSLTWLDVRGCLCINSICHSMITNIQSSSDTFFRLTYLDISDCVAVDDLGLRTLSFTCTRLETLHMRRCSRITDVGMQHIACHCTTLRELSISDCHKVRDFSLKEIARHCPSLRYLSLMRCAVTDAGIKMIAKGCSNLRYLNVRSCAGVTDVGVVYVAQNCFKLRSLDVGKCLVTNNTLSALGIHCPQLKRLSIKGCRNLTDVGIRAVVAQCCLLHYLNVEDCSITLDTYEFIREHCRGCMIEHTSLDI